MQQTKLLSVIDPERDAGNIRAAADILVLGGLVAIPTETVYGLAADALNPDAVRGIYVAKGRPSDNPMIVHISDVEMLALLAREVPSDAVKLAKAFWPGPLTMVLPKADIVPLVTTGGLDTVAVRLPAHPVAQAIIREAGVPLAAPSANLSGRPSPTTAQHCINDLTGRVHAVVDSGECSVGVESTVVCFRNGRVCLLRPGAVTIEQLEGIVGAVETDRAVSGRAVDGRSVLSPGMKYRHYAPNARVILVTGDSSRYVRFVNSNKTNGVFALCFDEDVAGLEVPYVSYGDGADPAAQAHRLFGALRELDIRGARLVYAHSPSQEGMGQAVYNRLIRAAAFRMVRT